MSIVIRICAERFMIAKINDDAFVDGIRGNQTFALFDQFMKVSNPDNQTSETLQGVMLMTPESIHLNAFMYEPIIDMSDAHLRRILTAVRALE